MKCRKLYGNHLVKLFNRSHARSSNMNSSEARMTFSSLLAPARCNNNDSLWYITYSDTWQSTNEIPCKMYSGEYFIGLWTPRNMLELSYFIQFRYAFVPSFMKNISGGCKRLVSGQEFHPKNLIEGTRYLFVPWKSSLSPFSLTIVDNRALRIVSLDSFHENRKIRVSSFKGNCADNWEE